MKNLANLLVAYQQKYDVSGKDLAKQIGLSESALSRLKQGKGLDAAALVRIIVWMVK